MNHKHHTRILLGAIAALGLSAPSAFAVAYSLTPSGTATAQDWNTSATWGVVTGTPGSAVGDTATVSGNFNGVAQTVNLSASPTNAITALTLGDTNGTPVAATISASASQSLLLNTATVVSGGAVGAVNSITAPIVHAGSTLTIGASTNPLSITGGIAPSTAANWTVENAANQKVTLGDIAISTGATTGIGLTLRNSTSVPNSSLDLNGTISNGGTVAANLSIGSRTANGVVTISGTNTYTGTTIVGVQGVSSIFRINSDQPFGPSGGGNLQLGNPANALNYLQAIGGDRTITKNTMTVVRNLGFSGSNNITLAGSTITFQNNGTTITNDLPAGKVATIGQTGGLIYGNNANSDATRNKPFNGAGTTVLASDVLDNNPALSGGILAGSRVSFQNTGTGKVVIAGNFQSQGGFRITSTGTVQIGNGGTTGSFNPTNGIAAVVNGSAGAGTLAYNRSDATSQAVVANGTVGIAQIGAGAVTLSNSQFNTGANSVGDGLAASKLVVTGGAVNASATTTPAAVAAIASSVATTVTLNGADSVSTLGLKVGQPVWLTSGASNFNAYIDSITDNTHFTVFGVTALSVGSASLSFGAGSALGTSAATTTVKNLSTLAGTGAISGGVTVQSGGRLAPGVNTVDADFSGRVNFGDAKTLTTGALTLNGANLDFDLAATAAGTSDFISSTGAVSFDSFSFTFGALTTGVLEVGAVYNLLGGVAGFTGDTGQIGTTFTSDLAGHYVPAYSINANMLQVVFSAIPEPSSFGLLAGMFALGGGVLRRRRQARS